MRESKERRLLSRSPKATVRTQSQFGHNHEVNSILYLHIGISVEEWTVSRHDELAQNAHSA